MSFMGVMKKKRSKFSQPRFVVYVDRSEIVAATKLATSSGLKGHNKWAGVVLRKELNRASQ